MVSGPGPKKLVDMNADWFLIAGDMSALPAISVNLEKLPRVCARLLGYRAHRRTGQAGDRRAFRDGHSMGTKSIPGAA